MLSMLEVVRIFLDLLDAEGWLLYVKEIRNLQARFYDCCILYISYHLLLLISEFFFITNRTHQDFCLLH